MRLRLFLLSRFSLTLVLLAVRPAVAQVCQRGSVNETQLMAKIMETANQYEHYLPNDSEHSGPAPDRFVIYRSAAIGGKSLIPVLRRFSKPGMSAYEVPGAIQASLAKLGDQQALDQLEEELNGKRSGGSAAEKLLQVGNDKAVAMLMTFLVAHLTDESLSRTFGDYSIDVRYTIIDGLGPLLLNPPLEASGVVSISLEKWAAWWRENNGKPLALSISETLQDPYLQCLARKIEWGFPEAILDLGTAGDPQVMPILRTVAQIGDQRGRVSGLNTVRGRAQTALARLGEGEEFKAIVDELESPGTVDAVLKMQFIGGRRAVEALMESLQGTNFLAEYPDYKFDGINAPGFKAGHDESIVNTLPKMVVVPPKGVGRPRNKRTWLNWWAKNRETAQIADPPARTSE